MIIKNVDGFETVSHMLAGIVPDKTLCSDIIKEYH